MAGEKILDFSNLSYDSSMDIFSSPASNLGITNMKYLEHKAVNQFNSESSVRFFINNSGPDYVYLPETKLKVKLRILQADGSKIPSLEEENISNNDQADVEKTSTDSTDGSQKKTGVAHVAPINNMLNSLYDQIEITLNDQIVSSGNTGHCFKAIISNLVELSNSKKKSRLQTSMFYDDTPGCLEAVNVGPLGANEGLKKRYEFFKESKIVELFGTLDVDVFKIRRYLLNNVNIQVVLHSTSTPFRLMSACTSPNYKIEILDISLIMCHVTPSNPILLAHQELMKEQNKLALYPFIQEDLRKFVIPKSSNSFYVGDLFQGKCPDRMILAMVSSAAVSGAYNKNPFNFKHNNLSMLSISVNGVQIPDGVIKTDFVQDAYTSAYDALFNTIPRDSDNGGDNGISYTAFKQGFALFSIDFLPQTRSGQFYPLKKDGIVKLEMRFDKPLVDTTVLLVLTYSPSYFEIDYTRKVYLGR